jgi:hypothetical protein
MDNEEEFNFTEEERKEAIGIIDHLEALLSGIFIKPDDIEK